MLYQVMVTVLVSGIITVSLASLLTNSLNDLKFHEQKATLLSQTQHLRSLVSMDSVWEATLAHSGNIQAFSCYLNPNETCPNNGADFRLMMPNGNHVFNHNNISEGKWIGFKGLQEECNSFSADPGTIDCPFAVRIYWIRHCSSPCVNPLAEIKVEFNYAPAAIGRGLNIDRYNFSHFVDGGSYPGSVIVTGGVRDTSSGEKTVIGDNIRMTKFFVSRVLHSP